MNIKIVSAIYAAKLLVDQPNKWNLISIRSMSESLDHPVDGLEYLAINNIVLFFDDITVNRFKFIKPSIEQVQKILNFTEKNNDNILVHCTAGISRSSATAFIVLCQTMPPEEAIKYLNKDIHEPNSLIIKFGAEILKNDNIVKVFDKWRLGT